MCLYEQGHRRSWLSEGPKAGCWRQRGLSVCLCLGVRHLGRTRIQNPAGWTMCPRPAPGKSVVCQWGFWLCVGAHVCVSKGGGLEWGCALRGSYVQVTATVETGMRGQRETECQSPAAGGNPYYTYR